MAQRFLRHGAQHRIAHRVAMGFVDGLETVDVQRGQAEALATADAALVFLVHQLLHVALVDQAGELVARGVLAQPRQCLRQFRPLQPRAVPHARQACRQQRHGRHHGGHQQEVTQFDGQRIDTRVAGHHEAHRRAEQQHGIDAEPTHLPRRNHKHAEHQHHHHHRKHRAAPGAQQHVGNRAAGQRKQHLRHGQRRLGPAPRPAATDEREEDHHAHQRAHGPPQHRCRRRHAHPHEVVHGGHRRRHHQHGQPGLCQAHALHRVSGQQQVQQAAHQGRGKGALTGP